MIPSSALGLLLAVAAVSPGYVYVWYASRRLPRSDKSTLMETAEFLLWGTATTGVSALLVLGLGSLKVRSFVDLSEWVRVGSSYLVDVPWRAVWSSSATFVLALLLALGASWLLHHRRPRSLCPEPVRWKVFAERPEKYEVFCSVTTTAGRVWEGYVFAYTLTDDAASGDLALRPPLYFWKADERCKVEGVDRVVIPFSQISEIAARYVPPLRETTQLDGSKTGP